MTELLYNHLEEEVSRYRDISHILRKLQDDGQVKKIHSLFKDMFDGEVKFTMKELAKIEDQKKEKLNLFEQCESNLNMFKVNCSLIVQSIFEKAFKQTFNETKAKYYQPLESTRVEDTTVESPSNNNLTACETPTIKKTEKSVKKSKSKRKSSPAKASTLNLSIDNTPKMKPKKLNLASTPIRGQSPLTKIFGGNSTASLHAAPSTAKERSFLQNSIQSTPLSKRQSRATLHGSQTPTSLNKSSSFVQSEFNHISGPGTFQKSPKKGLELVTTFSPGPAAYNTDESSLRRSPSPTIDKAQKICWFDEQAARNPSPGAGGRYPSHHMLSK